MYYENKTIIEDRSLLGLRMGKYYYKEQALIVWT